MQEELGKKPTVRDSMSLNSKCVTDGCVAAFKQGAIRTGTNGMRLVRS